MRLSENVIVSLLVAVFTACQSDNPFDKRSKPDFSASATLAPVPLGVLATGKGNGGSLQVIAIGANDSLPYLIYQTTAGNWHWGGALPDPNGVQFSAVTTGSGNGGSLQVIAIGAKDSLPYLIYQTTSGNWHWFGKLVNPNGVQFRGIAAGSGNNGYLQVVGIGAKDGLLYLIWQNGGGGWNWAGHLSAFGTVQFNAITAGRGVFPVSLDPALLFVGIGASDSLPYAIYQNRSNGAWVSGGRMLDPGVTFSAVAVGFSNTANYYSQVIALGATDGLPYVIRTDGRLPWSRSLLPDPGIAFSAFVTGSGNNNNGTQQVIGIGASDGLPYNIWNDNTTWWWGGQVPDPNGIQFKNIGMGPGNNGYLQVIVTGVSTGIPFLIWHDNSAASWFWGGQLPDP